MKIAIIGGSGFIGRNLAIKLLIEKHEVYIFSRKERLPKELVSFENIHLVTSLTPLASNLEGMEVVVNLAGEPIIGKQWTPSLMEKLRDSRIEFTKLLVNELEKVKNKPKMFLSGSAVGFYGLHESENPTFSEAKDAGTDFLAKLSVEWEKEALRAKNLGIRTILLRTGIVLSPESGALEKMLLPFKMFVGGAIGNGKQYISWIHIEDMVKAILFLMEHPKADGAFNLTAPNPCSNQKFSSLLGKVLGRPSLIPVPALALRVIFGEGAEALLKGQNVIPAKLLANGFQFDFPDLEPALKNLLN